MPSADDHPCGLPGARRPPGALQAEVMAALWAADSPMTAACVQRAVSGGPAYKTVLTVLGRLYAKGLLDRQPTGHAHAYTPRRGSAQTAAGQMIAALHRGPWRVEVLQRFVETLSPQEQAALRALLGSGD